MGSSLAGFDPVIFRIFYTLDISLVDSVFLQNSLQDLFLEFDSSFLYFFSSE